RRARVGDILFCVRGATIGRMNWADQEYAIGRGIAAIRHRTTPQLQPFVRAVVEYNLPRLLAQATGSTFPNVSRDQLACLPWPPLTEEELRAIAHILGTLDDKIEVNRRMSETLEEMARALFESWFVRFDPVRAKMEGRDPGVPADLARYFPNRLIGSEVGNVPEGWPVIPLKDFLTERNERVGEANVPEYSSTNNGLQPRAARFKKRLSASTSKYKLIRKGDIVFGLSREVLNFGLMKDEVGCVSPVYRVFSINSDVIFPDLLESMIRIRSAYYYGAVSASSREGQAVSPRALGQLK